jgi:hypothetical protein
MSWRSCAGSQGGHRFDPWIGHSSRRSRGRYRGALGQVCRCVRRRFCVGTGSWSGVAGRIRTDVRGDRRLIAASRRWSFNWQARTRLGLPADRRRTARPWHLDFGDLGADDPHPVGFRNQVRDLRAASARRSIASASPTSEVVRGLVARLSGTLSAASIDRAAVQIGAFEGT